MGSKTEKLSVASNGSFLKFQGKLSEGEDKSGTPPICYLKARSHFSFLPLPIPLPLGSWPLALSHKG